MYIRQIQADNLDPFCSLLLACDLAVRFHCLSFSLCGKGVLSGFSELERMGHVHQVLQRHWFILLIMAGAELCYDSRLAFHFWEVCGKYVLKSVLRFRIEEDRWWVSWPCEGLTPVGRTAVIVISILFDQNADVCDMIGNSHQINHLETQENVDNR